jgi:type I restriction enzyme S subunit
MSSEWITTTIGEQATLQRGFDITKATQQSGSIPVISSGGTNSFHNTAMAKGPGVILGRKGVVGSVYFVEEDYWAHDTTLWVKDFHGNDERFTYYFFLSKAKNLAALDVGTANPTLNRNHVHPIKVQWPKISEQQEIAAFLGTLDDRITLLRETNTTLEAIAQAQFKSWFVDFDPVRAKQEGREPEGMDADTAALFPDSFEESELGLVPRGWTVSAVYDLAQYINGAAYKAFEPNSECRGLPIIKIAELKAGVTSQTGYSEVKMPLKYLIRTKDILFSWSGNPDTSIDTFVWPHGEAWLNQHIFRVVPKSDQERSFILLTLKYLKPVFAEIARDKQTTGLGHVTVSDLKRLQVVQPNKQLLERWNELVDPILERAFFVEQKAQTLTTLRDTMLPRLISGQLRLPEADALIDEV